MAYRDLRATLKDLAATLTPSSHAHEQDAKIQQILQEVAEATGLADVEGYLPGRNPQEDHTAVIVYDKFSVGPQR